MPVAKKPLEPPPTRVGRAPDEHAMHSLSEMGLALKPQVRQLAWHVQPGMRRNWASKHIDAPTGDGGDAGGVCCSSVSS
jgi:hypothetical protein